MSRIDDLIAEHCPDGVEFKALSEVGEFIRGNGLQKKDFVDEGYPCIHYGQIYTYYGTSTSTTKSFISPDLARTLEKADPGDLVVTTTSENIEDVCMAVAWLGAIPIAIGGHSCVFKHTLDPMYAAYYFQTEQFEVQKRRFVTGTKVKDIKVSDIGRIAIPVPPPAIQREIARILATMESLEAELEAELVARRRQYAHYRDLLVTSWIPRAPLENLSEVARDGYFGDGDWVESKDQDPDGDVRLTQLADVGEGVFRDRSSRWMREDQALRLKCTLLEPGDILIARMPDPLGRSCQVPDAIGRAVTVVDVAILRVVRPDVDARYVMHAINCTPVRASMLSYQAGGTRQRISRTNLGKVRIPLPPLDEQARIVGILDSFDALVNDLSVGLPAELAARRKQYEYYRDRLLTFKEAV